MIRYVLIIDYQNGKRLSNVCMLSNRPVTLGQRLDSVKKNRKKNAIYKLSYSKLSAGVHPPLSTRALTQRV